MTTSLNPVQWTAQADVLFTLAPLFGAPAPPNRDRLTETLPYVLGLMRDGGLQVPATCEEALQALHQQMQNTPVETWEAEHNRLFDGPTQCPPNEAAYVPRDRGALLADLQGFYTAFGWHAAGGRSQKPDHIRVELEFFAVLLVHRAAAVQQGDDVAESVTREAMDAFAFDHLGEWLPVFTSRLIDATCLPLYRLAGQALVDVWHLIAETAQLPLPEPGPWGMNTAASEGTPYECGMAAREELAQIGRPAGN